MPRPFNVNAECNQLRLPPETRQQIHALMLDLDLNFREVIIRLVAEGYRREIGDGERDLAAELDDLKRRLEAAGL